MDGSASDDNTDFIPDDAFSMICGDLGLGENSRSSASLRYELEVLGDSDLQHTQKQKHKSLATTGAGFTDDLKLSNSNSRSSSVEENRTFDKNTAKQKNNPKDKLTRRRVNSKSKTSSKSGDEENGCENDEHFPSYADVPYGTSLRQQRKLYEKNLGSIIKKHSNSVDADSLPTSGE